MNDLGDDFMVYVFSSLFIAASLSHLVFCFFEKEKARILTKPLLMPLLAFSVSAFLVPHFPASRTALILIVCALMFGWIGDMLLITTENKKRFLLGAASFLVGHFFWMSQYVSYIRNLPVWIFAFAVPCYIAALALVFVVVGKPKGIMGISLVLYGTVLCLLNLTGIAAFYVNRSVPALLFFFGSVLFVVSDTILGRSVLKSDFRRSAFFIMLTYIAAQTLLACGSVLPFLV